MVFLLLTSCAANTPEQGRMPWDDDVSCLRKELSGQASFAIAVAFCRREEDGRLLPLDLRNAPDLQQKAKEEGFNNIIYK
ncbi:hypothetical protein [Entomobacter blattae]|nr:hypothetical protein [Entomobacter blattae]